MSQIIIDSNWLGQVKKVLAFPGVSNLLLSDDEIKDYCIFPSLQKYFTKFPITEELSQTIINEVLIPKIIKVKYV